MPDQERLFTPQVLSEMSRHDWPGNVRELRNYVERSVVLQKAGPAIRRSTPGDCLRRCPGRSTSAFRSRSRRTASIDTFERAYLTALLEACRQQHEQGRAHGGDGPHVPAPPRAEARPAGRRYGGRGAANRRSAFVGRLTFSATCRGGRCPRASARSLLPSSPRHDEQREVRRRRRPPPSTGVTSRPKRGATKPERDARRERREDAHRRRRRDERARAALARGRPRRPASAAAPPRPPAPTARAGRARRPPPVRAAQHAAPDRETAPSVTSAAIRSRPMLVSTVVAMPEHRERALRERHRPQDVRALRRVGRAVRERQHRLREGPRRRRRAARRRSPRGAPRARRTRGRPRASPPAFARASIGKRMRVTLKSSW